MIDSDHLPKNWLFVELGQVVSPSRETVKPDDESDLPYIGLENVESETTRILGTVPFKSMKSAGLKFGKDAVLFGRMRSYQNKVIQPGFHGVCSPEFIVFNATPYIYPAYLKYFINSEDFKNYTSKFNTGDRPRISWEQIKKCKFPLAPLSVQKLLAAKIEEELSKLEVGVRTISLLRKKIIKYYNAVLIESASGEISATWRIDNPNKLTDGIQLVKNLRARTALQGQDLFNENALTYNKPQDGESINDIQVPKGWGWARASEIVQVNRTISYGVLQPGEFVENGVPLIRVGDIEHGKISISGVKRIDSEISRKNAKTILEGEEVVMTLVGSIGRTAVVSEALKGCNVARAVGVIPIDKKVNSHWVELWYRNPLMIARMTNSAHEVARKTLNLEDVRNSWVAIPSIEEQEFIVKEVQYKFGLIDKLNKALELTEKKSIALRRKILAQAFRGDFSLGQVQESADSLLDSVKKYNELQKSKEAEPAIKDSSKRKLAEKNTLTVPVMSLFDVIKSSPEGISSEEAFDKAGYDDKSVDAFFQVLRELIDTQKVAFDKNKAILIALNS